MAVASKQTNDLSPTFPLTYIRRTPGNIVIIKQMGQTLQFTPSGSSLSFILLPLTMPINDSRT